MTNIKVLGSGCRNCRATMQLLETVARESGVDVELEKVEEMQDIVRYGVLSTPGVVIDGTVVHAGGVPSRAHVENWMKGLS